MTEARADEADAGGAYEEAACGLFTLAPDGTIERFNRYACVWTGQSAEGLSGRRFIDLLTMGSKLFYHTHWLPLMEMQGSIAEVQLELRVADERTLPVLVNAIRRADKRVDLAMLVATDRRKYERELLLARRRAEELLEREREAQEGRARAEAELRLALDQFRTLAENSPDVIARIDRAGHIMYVNGAVESVRGMLPSDYVGKHLRELGLTAEAEREWMASLARALEGHSVSHTVRYDSSGGVVRELESRVVPERNARGEITSVLALTRDVTALRLQEREAQQRAVLAEQLVGIVSHDLRNPLNAILLATQLLETSDIAPHLRTVRRISTAAQRASRLVAELLDFTQARLGGGLSVSPGEVDVHVLAAECVDELRLAWPGRAIEHRRAGERNESRGLVDADRFAQIVSNLVSNAITYGSPEAPVTVTTVVSAARLELLVHNAGPPIPGELQKQMFEPLRRGDAQVERGLRSVGLGLYIVREIAAAHGGQVTVRSVAGEGTTFRVVLPRAARRAAAPPAL